MSISHLSFPRVFGELPSGGCREFRIADSTFRDNYKPKFTATFQLENFGSIEYAFIELEKNSDTTMDMHWWGGMLGPDLSTVPRLWRYRYGYDQKFFTHSVVDLSDLINSVDFKYNIKLAIRSYWWQNEIKKANPIFKSIYLLDNELGIDTNIVANTKVNGFWMDGMCGFNLSTPIPDTLKVTSNKWNFNPNITGVVDNLISIPTNYKLFQNYPNPFNPGTSINYSVPKTQFVSLKVFDILGRQVASLVNEEKPSGNYSIKFNANKLASGLYIYQLKAGEFFKSAKMVLLK